MSTRLPNATRLFAPLAAALVLLAGCGDDPTAPDPLDAESLATRLELLSRRAPQADGILLSAAGVHFRDAGRVTPIAVIIDGQAETWYAASSEMVFPSMPCLPPASGLSCPEPVALEQRHLFAVDGVNATRLLVFSTSMDGSRTFDQADWEWPALPASGILLVRGSGVQAFATAGSLTSSLVTLGDCPAPLRRGPRAPTIESCERVSIGWQVDAELTSLRAGAAAPDAIDVVIPAVDVAGTRQVLSPPTFPGP